jgi:hypothetical protein
MAEMIRPISPLLPDAIAVWTGWGVSPMPKRNDERVIAHFGVQVAQELLPVIKSLQKDFYVSAADGLAGDLNEMGKIASERFRREHPDISEDIVKILAWCYTYDFR